MLLTVEYSFDTIAEFFDLEPTPPCVDTFEASGGQAFGGSMTGEKHSDYTKQLMREAALGKPKPSLHRGGALVRDGKVFEFTCLRHFCKENGLSSGHVCELLKGKRKSVKGWTL